MLLLKLEWLGKGIDFCPHGKMQGCDVILAAIFALHCSVRVIYRQDGLYLLPLAYYIEPTGGQSAQDLMKHFLFAEWSRTVGSGFGMHHWDIGEQMLFCISWQGLKNIIKMIFFVIIKHMTVLLVTCAIYPYHAAEYKVKYF